MKISAENIREYLLARDLIGTTEEALIEPIGGFWGGMGVSSTLIRVTRASRSFVLKQPLAELAVKEYWPCETSRIRVEKDCIEVLATIVGPERVPKITFFDADNDVLVMEMITPDWQIWKSQLMAGVIDERVPQHAGELIAAIHNKTYLDESIKEQFSDLGIFQQLRIDPYYKTTAKRHPDVAELIEQELQQVLDSPVCLVLGDFSPKNTFTKDGELILLDHEIAHYGEPSVDSAFCLNHLLLKFLHFSLDHSQIEHGYLGVARTFWDAYCTAVDFVDKEAVDRQAIPNLGCFMLARIDGKSPAEYIIADSSKDAIRKISKNILRNGYAAMSDVFAMIEEELQREIRATR